ncbi:hypothetical protein FKG94_25160 [Exilibacterium tricleocarpae]|uniref:Uncharacterized protein n=1 Tax=Exilibacterium tricleocarpae TaxID=2591008 RepID=A0A545SRU4_9GAMM|nr:hypothetical protein FKG94_25160 [Exilibacterium tricleocarpae]
MRKLIMYFSLPVLAASIEISSADVEPVEDHQLHRYIVDSKSIRYSGLIQPRYRTVIKASSESVVNRVFEVGRNFKKHDRLIETDVSYIRNKLSHLLLNKDVLTRKEEILKKKSKGWKSWSAVMPQVRRI